MRLDELAVVVPIGPGERAWRGLLPELAGLPAEARVVLVATDADDLPRGAEPATRTLAAELVTLAAGRGRALQQNVGAGAAARPWIWFLHADSRLAPTTLPALAASLTRAPDALGYFDLRFAADGPRAVHLNALGVFVRSRWLGLPFGDQGFFLARAVFERLGGFDTTVPFGEDHALVWAARRAGVAVVPARAPLYTSARKYAEGGWLATTARHVWWTARQAVREARRPQGAT
jgi:hypothetical protein